MSHEWSSEHFTTPAPPAGATAQADPASGMARVAVLCREILDAGDAVPFRMRVLLEMIVLELSKRAAVQEKKN